jgi:acetyl/propionyl-CoA carboxylase alpha subunit
MFQSSQVHTPNSGYHGENQDAAFLKTTADEMGYPVLIKAVLGGGGKVIPTNSGNENR